MSVRATKRSVGVGPGRALATVACLVALLAPSEAAARHPSSGLHLFGELAGNGLLYSVNAEYCHRGILTARVGTALNPFAQEARDLFMFVPVSVGAMFGSRAFKLETTAGYTWTGVEEFRDQDFGGFLAGTLGLRFVAPSRAVFRAFYMHAYVLESELTLPWFGASVGILE